MCGGEGGWGEVRGGGGGGGGGGGDLQCRPASGVTSR